MRCVLSSVRLLNHFILQNRNKGRGIIKIQFPKSYLDMKE